MSTLPIATEKESCCGMPRYEQGDLQAVEKLVRKNIPALLELAREGYAILTPVPSCTLMFKQEVPLMFPGDADIARSEAHRIKGSAGTLGLPRLQVAAADLERSAGAGEVPRAHVTALQRVLADTRAALRQRGLLAA